MNPRAHAARLAKKCQASQASSARTAGQAQPKRLAMERLLGCEASAEAIAQAMFNAQPIAMEIAAEISGCNCECARNNQNTATGNTMAISKITGASFFMSPDT